MFSNSALLTDLYQLTMTQAYLASGQTDVAVFEFFIRKMPSRRNFFVSAGIETVVDFIMDFTFSQEDIDWLKSTNQVDATTLRYLANFQFTGDVDAVPEGTLVFPNEPLLRVTASLPQAQHLETRLINILHYQTLVASKAARMVLAAPGKLLVDFGLRRAHGADAGLVAARASYIAGFSGTATISAKKLFQIPVYGTMAHSYIQSFDDESVAFENFARARPEQLILLIDTYDTVRAARKVVHLARRLQSEGIHIHGVRIDSGDLIQLSKEVRKVLDEGGLSAAIIFASGGLDEDALLELAQADAPIDGFGIGTSLATSSDVPALDCAYKLQEYGGIARRKLSPGKVTWPGRKQIWRCSDKEGRFAGDVVSLYDDCRPGEPLLEPVLRNGERVKSKRSLCEIRESVLKNLSHLPESLQQLDKHEEYPVEFGGPLIRLASELDHKLRPTGESPK